MNHKLEIINPASYPEWNDVVLSTPDYSFFHSSGWMNVLQITYNYEPLCFVYKISGVINALIPTMIVNSFVTGRRMVCLPFSDYCAPLEIHDHLLFEDLFNEILNYAKSEKLSSIEIRGGNNFLENVVSSNHFYVHSLELNKSEEELFAGFSGSTRRNIKKAIREGVIVRIEDTMKAVNRFYDMNCVTRRYHGLPPQPRSFFKNIFTEIIEKNKGVVISAFYNEELIASSLFLQFGNKVIYKFGASNRAYLHVRPNNIVIWEAIKYYNNKGCEELNFGKTETGNEGLKRFKIGWGASEEIINVYKYSLKKDEFIQSKSYTVGFYNHIFKKTPLIILKAIGNIIYKHIG